MVVGWTEGQADNRTPKALSAGDGCPGHLTTSAASLVPDHDGIFIRHFMGRGVCIRLTEYKKAGQILSSRSSGRLKGCAENKMKEVAGKLCALV